MPHLYRPQMTIQSNSYIDKNIRKSIGATVYLMHPVLLFVYATLSLRKGIMHSVNQSRLKLFGHQELIVWLIKRTSMRENFIQHLRVRFYLHQLHLSNIQYLVKYGIIDLRNANNDLVNVMVLTNSLHTIRMF